MVPLSPDQVSEQWGVIASDYEKAFEGLSSQFAADALELLNLRPGERVIDVAAGTGAFSLLAARGDRLLERSQDAPADDPRDRIDPEGCS